jgi:NSS family neurotransmitter:Na+ symporter
VFENIFACVMDLTGWGRKKTCLIVGGVMLLLSLPCVFGYNIWSGFTPFGEGTAILDLEDFVVSNLLLPIGALIFTLFCVTRYGWGWKSFMAEANTGKGLKVQGWMRWVFTIAVPVIIVIIFVMGLVSFFS